VRTLKGTGDRLGQQGRVVSGQKLDSIHGVRVSLEQRLLVLTASPPVLESSPPLKQRTTASLLARALARLGMSRMSPPARAKHKARKERWESSLHAPLRGFWRAGRPP
jgi:hypothetical protein